MVSEWGVEQIKIMYETEDGLRRYRNIWIPEHLSVYIIIRDTQCSIYIIGLPDSCMGIYPQY